MGLVQEPELRDYWSQDKTFHYSPIADKISRTRFEEISRYLHFVDSQTLPARGEDGHHRLQKVKNVVDAVKEKFLLVYKPSQNISVDEAMIPFKGRSSMKQYIPKKPIKRGFKIWVAADTNGYFLDLQVYVGKAADGVTTEHGLGERVVLELTKPFREKWYHIYCDNFFTSPKLFQKLHTNGPYACGTVRKDRKAFQVSNPGQRREFLPPMWQSGGYCLARQEGSVCSVNLHKCKCKW
jgi:hypothetical protein